MLLFVITVFVWMLFYTAFLPCVHQNTEHTKQPFTRATYRTATLPTIDLTQQTAPPYHYPSQLLSSLSDCATEPLSKRLKKNANKKSRYQNG